MNRANFGLILPLPVYMVYFRRTQIGFDNGKLPAREGRKAIPTFHCVAVGTPTEIKSSVGVGPENWIAGFPKNRRDNVPYPLFSDGFFIEG
jgi:hypothetical protein